MRRLNIFLGCLFLFAVSISISGQNYQPLLRGGLEWDILHGDGTEICKLSGGNRYFFGNDTNISGQLYKTIHAMHIIALNSGPFCPPFAIDVSYSFPTGMLIREDTTLRQVFIRPPGNTTDELLYDFSLNPGDTFHSWYASGGITLTVDSTGWLTTYDGVSRRIIYLSNEQYFIEGIGGSQGLQSPLFEAVGGWEEPICTRENDIHLWGDQCLGLVATKDEAPAHMQLYPNPADNIIYVNAGNHRGLIMTLSDPAGKEVLQVALKNPIKGIDVSHLGQGIYFYSISGNDYLSSGKVVIQRD